MGMVVRTNTMANNAFRQLGMNNSALSKSLEKLSSGYRINRAADDAAGLAISEKMKAQITGLEAASANAEDGISLVQTAEGALNEVHDMLNRMAELATKAANGTYTDEQRNNYQDELTQLQSEIDRIADSTNFNSLNLLDGSLSSPVGEVISAGSNATGTDTAASFTVDLSAATSSGNQANDTYKLTVGGVDVISDQDTGATATTGTAIADLFNGKTVQIDGVDYTISANAGKLTFTADTAGTAATPADKTFTLATGTGSQIVAGTSTGNIADEVQGSSQTAATAASSKVDFSNLSGTTAIGGTITIGNNTYKIVEAGKGTDGATDEIEVDAEATGEEIADAVANALNGNDTFNGTYNATAANGVLTVEAQAAGEGEISITTANMGGLVLQVGDTNDAFNKLTVSVQDMHSDTLGVDAESINVKTAPAAGAAIKNINAAIDKVSEVRSNLGAIQNRLDHTVNNLDTTAENLDAANSRIRDTDMASEMMEYTKMSVLVQSAQAMLAQANQQPQAVLQLLQ